MPSTADFRDRALGLLLPFGPVTARSMFGGYGLYLDGVMFALIAYDTLYFKVDDGNRDDYIEAGTGPFTYAGRHRPVEMSYYRIPEVVMEDLGVMAQWAERAHQAARRSKAKSPPRKSRARRPADA